MWIETKLLNTLKTSKKIMKIKQFTEDQLERLRAWQDDNGFERIPLVEKGLTIYTRADSTYSCKGITLYAEENGEIQGIISRNNNSYHPKFDHLNFAIANEKKSLMVELMDQLLKLSPTDAVPLQITLEESVKNQWAWFLEKYFFRLTLTSDCPEIDITASLAKLQQPILGESYRILNYNQLNSIESAALQKFRREGYVNTHQWSPPISLDNPLWSSTDRSDAEKENSIIILHAGKIIACSDLVIDNDDYWLGWGWTCNTLNLGDKTKFWSAMLFSQLTFCQQKNKKLFGEFDSTDTDGSLKRQLMIEKSQDRFFILQQIK
ncbi:hypothetical protein [Motilimonas sp. KMU-193]|uniref:hypothetical protein n=1 Tax=Motilimonas sp. KMU-193 TaxID=3388668 RepID=UPI00396B267E